MRRRRWLMVGILAAVAWSMVGTSLMTGCAKKASAAYTCPMHPEVTSDKPGTCPKCKMDLVKK